MNPKLTFLGCSICTTSRIMITLFVLQVHGLTMSLGFLDHNISNTPFKLKVALVLVKAQSLLDHKGFLDLGCTAQAHA